MSTDINFVRARRRYRALLREKKNLDDAGSRDEFLEKELSKLEAEFPDLREGAPALPAAEATPEAIPATVTEEPQRDSPKTDATSSSSSTPMGASGTKNVTHNRLRGEDLPPLLPPDEDEVLASFNRDRDPAPKRQRSVAVGRTMFVLQCFNEMHKRSAFGPINFFKIVLVGILNAVLHYFFLDPRSIFGMHIVPSAFCVAVHLNNLYTIYLKRRGSFSSPMLLVYIAFDFVPSIVASFVLYTVSLSCFSLFFGTRVAFS